MAQVRPLFVIPLIAPVARDDAAVKFRPVLRVIHETQFRGRIEILPRSGRESGRHEGREAQIDFRAVFHIVFIAVALQSGNGLIGPSEFDRQVFRAVEQVAVAVGEYRGGPQVSRGVRTLQFRTDRVRGIGFHPDVAVEQGIRRIRFRVVDGGVAEGRQAVQGPVGIVRVHGAKDAVRADIHLAVIYPFDDFGPVVEAVGQSPVVQRVGRGVVIVVVLVEGDAAHTVGAVVFGMVHAVRPLETERKGGTVVKGHRVGTEGNIFLVQAVISLVAECRDNAVAFGLQQTDVEWGAAIQKRGKGIG